MAEKEKKKKKDKTPGTDQGTPAVAPVVMAPTPLPTPTTTLTVEGKEYDLALDPPPESKIVTDARKEVTEGLELGNMVVDLKATSQLLFVAACGVAGARNHPELPGKVAGIRFALLEALSDTDTTMNAVNLAAKDVVLNLRDGFLRTLSDSAA